MAYVLGFFAADGYITVNRRGGEFWCIQITDKELLESIKASIGSNHTIGSRSGAVNEKRKYRLQIGSIEMCNDLRKLGYAERKTKCIVLPSIPKKYFPDFTRGYFDGDGNVWVGDIHKNRIKQVKVIFTAFTSCSHDFLQQLHNKLLEFGVKGGSIYRAKQTYSRLQLSTHDSLKLYEIMYNTGAVNNLYLQRKKLVFEKYITLRV
jgi:intein-encoded DNA endonuclease-like protein